jgi:predicted AlkP superfamily phosphohydrolase/phosphomutase
MVSGFLTPSKESHYTYPENIGEELDAIAEGDYIIDVRDFRTDDKKWLIEQIHTMTRRRFKVVRHWIKVKPWDIFMFVEMGVDRIHHGFWRYMDKDHRLYEPGHPYENVIQQYYQYLDKEIGRLLDVLPPDTAVMVVSDHGAKAMKGAICINEWLMEKGYLSLKENPRRPGKIEMSNIDWSKTSAWGNGGYCGRIFINVKGREPQGIVLERDYEAFRDRIKKEIATIPDEAGHPIRTRVFKPEETYRATNNIPPDLIVYFGDLDWRSAGTVGHGRTHIFENDTGPDDANHSEEGIFIFKDVHDRSSGTSLARGKRIEGASIYDIAPTVLDFFGLPIPEDMIGSSLYTGKAEGKWISQEREKGTGEEDYSEEEADAIRRRLEDLGYI